MPAIRLLVVALAALAALGAPDPEPLKIHLISGSKEYKSESSLKEFGPWLEQNYTVSVTASWASDGAKELENADAIPGADVLLVFARRLKLPEEQMKLIRAHWEAGKPVVGLRTASHAFQQADNEVFDRQVMGNNYNGHYGNEPVKVEPTPAGAAHPVLEGVGPFTSRKLYKAGELAPTAVVLQTGDIGKDEHPVTIVREYNGGRMFYSSLGVPEDFEDPDFRRMLVNAIFWTARRDPAAMKK